MTKALVVLGMALIWSGIAGNKFCFLASGTLSTRPMSLYCQNKEVVTHHGQRIAWAGKKIHIEQLMSSSQSLALIWSPPAIFGTMHSFASIMSEAIACLVGFCTSFQHLSFFIGSQTLTIVNFTCISTNSKPAHLWCLGHTHLSSLILA